MPQNPTRTGHHSRHRHPEHRSSFVGPVSAQDAEPNRPRDAGHDYALLVALYVVVRVALLAAAALVAHIDAGGHLSGPLEAWDGRYFVEVATHGYPAHAARADGHLAYSSAGFEPGYPLLVRLFALPGIPDLLSAVIVSVLGGLAAVLVVFRLGSHLGGRAVGWKSAVAFMVFPGMAVSWGITYSECVGLALAAGCLLAIAKQRWVLAGVVGAAATLTSPLALPLALAALAAAIQQIRSRKLPVALLTTAMIPLGFIGFAAWEAIHYHDALFWWHEQHQAWGASVDFGKSLLLLLTHFWAGGYQGKAWLEWIGLAVVAAMIYSLSKARLPAFVNSYVGGVFLLLFVSNQLGFKPRLLTWAFPALIAVAVMLRDRWWQVAVLGCALMLPVVFIAYTALGNTMIQP